jgi:hypothetical protein
MLSKIKAIAIAVGASLLAIGGVVIRFLLGDNSRLRKENDRINAAHNRGQEADRKANEDKSKVNIDNAVDTLNKL